MPSDYLDRPIRSLADVRQLLGTPRCPDLADLLGRPLTEREAEITAAHRMARHATDLAWRGAYTIGVKGNYVRWQEAIANLADVDADLNAVLALVAERVAA